MTDKLKLFKWEDSLFEISIAARSLDEARQKGNAQLNPIQYSLVSSAPIEIVLMDIDDEEMLHQDVFITTHVW